MKNRPEQNRQETNNQYFWQEFENFLKNIWKKIQDIEKFQLHKQAPQTIEKISVKTLIELLRKEKEERKKDLIYLNKKFAKIETNLEEKQKTERDIKRNIKTIKSINSLIKKIKEKANIGINNLKDLKIETQKLKKQNLYIFKISQKIINFEKLEKNNYKKELIESGEIKNKVFGIKGIKDIKKFEIIFYKQKILSINKQLNQTLSNDEKQKLETDKIHFTNIINKKTNDFDQTINALQQLINNKIIDKNLQIIDEKKLNNQNKETLNKGKNILNLFNNYNDEKLKTTLKLKEKIENNIGRPLGKTQTDQFRDMIEYLYKNSPYQKKLNGLTKQLGNLSTIQHNIKHPSAEQKMLEENQQLLKEYTEKLNHLMNKPHHNTLDGIIIDQLRKDKTLLLKKIKEITAKLQEKKQESLKILKEQIQIKLKKFNQEYSTINENQKILKLIWLATPNLLSLPNINSVFHLHKITKQDYIAHQKTLNLIKSILNTKIKSKI